MTYLQTQCYKWFSPPHFCLLTVTIVSGLCQDARILWYEYWCHIGVAVPITEESQSLQEQKVYKYAEYAALALFANAMFSYLTNDVMFLK